MKILTVLIQKILIVLAIIAASNTYAQNYPNAPVKIVVPFPPGGTTDILARVLSNELSKKWMQPVVVENKPGASGTVFSEQLTHMPADGYTLMVTATHHVINPSLFKTLKYNTRTDFTPISLVAGVPNVLVVNPAFPAKTVQELIVYAKANPGKIMFGSAGTGGANHLSGELFKAMAKIDMVHVPYKGAAPALNDLLGNQISVMFDSVPGVLSHIKAGKLRALGVTSLTRSTALPTVPTISESGLKGFEALAWFGMYAPPQMAPELLNKLSTDVQTALQSPQVKNQFAEQGADAGNMNQAEYAKYVDAEISKWAKVISDANIKAE